MKRETIRAILALLVVGVFMAITAALALYPIFGTTNVEMDAYASFFSKTASVYTGIIGVIIGYYFGRDVDEKKESLTIRPESKITRTENHSPDA